MSTHSLQTPNIACSDNNTYTNLISGINRVCAYQAPSPYPIQNCCVGYDFTPAISIYGNCTYYCSTNLTILDFKSCVENYGSVSSVACFPGIQAAGTRSRGWSAVVLAMLVTGMTLLG